jgi:hypothetical protein
MTGSPVAAAIMEAAGPPPPPPVPPLAAYTTPNPVTGYFHSDQNLGFTDYTNCMASGGHPPYQFSWQYFSGFQYQTTDPNSANIQFVFHTSSPLSARWMVTVFDAWGAQITVPVDVQSSGTGPITPPPPSGGGVAPTVTVTPSSVTSHKPGGGTSTFTFNSSVSGGVGPFQYLWSEGDHGTNGASTTFSKQAPNQDTNDGTVTLQVTGADGGVGYGHGDWHAVGF